MNVIEFTKTNERVVIPLLFTAITLVLFHGIFKSYAFTDDYEFLLNAHKENFLDVFYQGGRPLFGLAQKWMFTTFNDLESLPFIRSVSLIGSLLFLNFSYFWLRKCNYTLFESAFVTILMLCSASFAIKIGWTLGFAKPWTAIISLSSGILLLKFYEKGGLHHLISAIVLGVLSLTIYQPIYTFSIIPLVVYWIKTKPDYRFLSKVAFIHLSIYGLYFILFKYLIYVMEVPPLERSSISLDVLGRMEWFITEPLKRSMHLNLLFADKAFRWIAFIVVLVSWGFLVKAKSTSIVNLGVNFLIVMLFLFLSMLPNLVSSENWVAYRTMGTLIMMNILALTFTVNSIKSVIIKVVVMIVICFISIVLAYINFNAGFINIQVKELSCIEKEVTALPEDISSIQVKIAPVDFLENNEIVKRSVTDEFGRLSTSSTWVPEPMVKLLLKKHNKSAQVELIEDISELSSSAYFIDVGEVYLKCQD